MSSTGFVIQNFSLYTDSEMKDFDQEGSENAVWVKNTIFEILELSVLIGKYVDC